VLPDCVCQCFQSKLLLGIDLTWGTSAIIVYPLDPDFTVTSHHASPLSLQARPWTALAILGEEQGVQRAFRAISNVVHGELDECVADFYINPRR
jgi:hypothetical protein